ncbi:GMP synthase-like protein [Daphnia magna]|uniref:GMP synthase-like protein n=1 Tax=Daphnia magna TaxID=35525 RepID=A0A164RJ63_9CRUS|nr:GMP synthase-like protein [Daphnia magna]
MFLFRFNHSLGYSLIHRNLLFFGINCFFYCFHEWRFIPQSLASHADTHPQIYGVIDCRVREQCVESDILALETPAALLLQQGYKAIIISGGPSIRSGCPTIRPSNLYRPSSSAGNLSCMQLINKALGGMVERKDVNEDGQFKNQGRNGVPIV